MAHTALEVSSCLLVQCGVAQGALGSLELLFGRCMGDEMRETESRRDSDPWVSAASLGKPLYPQTSRVNMHVAPH